MKIKKNRASMTPPAPKNGISEEPPVSDPAPAMTEKELRSAFEAYSKANDRVEAAKKSLDKALSDRSVIVEQIAKGRGRGPFGYKGASLTIVCRLNKSTGESTWFFKGPTKTDIIQVGD